MILEEGLFFLGTLKKSPWGGSNFWDDEDVAKEVLRWPRGQPDIFRDANCQWDKCLNVQGDYDEKTPSGKYS